MSEAPKFELCEECGQLKSRSWPHRCPDDRDLPLMEPGSWPAWAAAWQKKHEACTKCVRGGGGGDADSTGKRIPAFTQLCDECADDWDQNDARNKLRPVAEALRIARERIVDLEREVEFCHNIHGRWPFRK